MSFSHCILVARLSVESSSQRMSVDFRLTENSMFKLIFVISSQAIFFRY